MLGQFVKSSYVTVYAYVIVYMGLELYESVLVILSILGKTQHTSC